MLRRHIKVNEFGHIIFDKLLTLCKDIHFQTLKKKKKFFTSVTELRLNKKKHALRHVLPAAAGFELISASRL